MTTHGLDACLQLVAHRDRRRIIHNLRHETTGTTTVTDLVDQLHRSDAVSKHDPPEDEDALAVQLLHVHLPKLAAYGVVEFEHRSGAVRYHPNEQVETVLDALAIGVSLPDS
jgi:predicted transcriptional regulator